MLLTAAMIIGTGLFAALAESAEKAGAGLPLAIVVGGVIVLLLGLSAASVGINIPEEGGGVHAVVGGRGSDGLRRDSANACMSSSSQRFMVRLFERRSS